MIGRWLCPFTFGTALMSSMLRVQSSKVRTPRSHSTTSGLPSARMYSADMSRSFTVALMPRLSSTGVLRLAALLQQVEVLHVAGADLEHVGVAARPARPAAGP